jgi:hypothetical protein
MDVQLIEDGRGDVELGLADLFVVSQMNHVLVFALSLDFDGSCHGAVLPL